MHVKSTVHLATSEHAAASERIKSVAVMVVGPALTRGEQEQQDQQQGFISNLNTV